MWLSWVRRTLGIPGYWSLSGYAKHKVKSAVSFIFDFEDSVLRHARERGVDGVICGHIHSATIRDHNGIAYINCGDWVDSCTAILEHQDGRMELLRWGGEAELSAAALYDSHHLVGQQGCGEIEGVKVRNRREFHDIEADDAPLARH